MTETNFENDLVEEQVIDVLAQVLSRKRSTLSSLGSSASLVDDFGLDSLTFVDVTVALEERFGLHEFPMQQWADEEKASRSRYTLGSLVSKVRSIVERGWNA